MPVLKMSVRLFAAVLSALVISVHPALAQSLPAGWSTMDIGSVGVAGSAQGSGSSLTLAGAGADVWGTTDAFRYAYTTLSGDGSIVAQVSTLENVDAWTKAGVMMRDTLSANARHAFMVVSPGKGLAFQRRTATGATSANTAGGTGLAPYFVKLTRTGNTFMAAKSTNGVTWTTVGSDTIAMGSTIYVGVAVSSHVAGNLAIATFASTAVTPGAAVTTTTATVTAASATTLRVLHWNSHHGGTGTDGVYDPDRFVAAIVKVNPDVISLNEIDDQSEADRIIGALAAKTGKTWNSSYDDRGNLVLSKLATTGKSVCLVNSGAGRKAAHLSLLLNGKPLNMWSAHLALDSSSVRQGEVNALQGCAQQWPEARIIAGDFNTQSDTTEIADMSASYVDAWLQAKKLGTAINYTGNCDGCTRNSRIDYVFSSNGAATLTLKSAEIFDTRAANGVMPSDHKPMLVIYNVK